MAGHRVFVPTMLGEVFKQERLKRNISQMALAERIFVSNSVISKIERGAYQVSIDCVQALCKYYGWDWEELSQYFVRRETTDHALEQLQLLALEIDIDMVNSEMTYEKLRHEEGLRRAERGPKSTILVHYAYLKGRYFEKNRKWNNALEHYEKAMQMAEQFPEEIKQTNLLAAILSALGRVCIHQHKLDQALMYLDEGIKAYHPEGDYQHVIYMIQINKSIALERMQRDLEAFEVVEEVWAEKDRIIHSAIRLSLTLIRVDLLNKFQRYDEAISLAMECLNDARIDRFIDLAFDFWSSLGNSYAKKGCIDNAKLAYQTALILEKDIKKKHLAIITYIQLGLLCLEQRKGRLAQKTLEKAVYLGRKHKDDYRLIKALIALGECLAKQGGDKEALERLKEAHRLSQKHELHFLIFESLARITDLCQKMKSSEYQKYAEQFQQITLQLLKGGDDVMKHVFNPKMAEIDPID
jgi:tetratricopeptide (TPR) repeat protein